MATSMPKRAVVWTDIPTEKPTESLVLRTAMDSIEQDSLKQRPVMPVSARTVVIPLQAQTKLPIGKAWVYLYPDLKLAKRVLKIQDRHLAKFVCGPGEDRYFFRDVEYIEQRGTKEIAEKFIIEIQALLRSKKAIQENKPVVVQAVQLPAKPVVAKSVADVAPPKPVEPARPPVQEPVRVQPPVAVQAEQPKPVNRTVKGQSFSGAVVAAGMARKNGPSGSYETFCVTLNDGVREVPFNGVEIERQIRDLGIRVGENIRIVDMGKIETVVPGVANPRPKNLYQVTRLGANG